MEENMFSQEQLEEQIQQAQEKWENEILSPLKSDLEEVKGKLPQEKSDAEIAIETKQQELFSKEVALELKSAGLEKFVDIVKVSNSEELKTTIEALTSIVNELKVDTGYIPDNHKSTDEFTNHEQNKNTVGMIGSKLAKLFN